MESLLRSPIMAAALLALPLSAHAQTAFDGVWGVVLACPPAQDAAGYRLDFPARVTAGRLRGEAGRPGMAGYLLLEGTIQPSGAATLAGQGLVGRASVAIGHIPVTSPYRFEATARFTGNTGTGERTTTRPCTLAFTRN